jgi:hypothetical protein
MSKGKKSKKEKKARKEEKKTRALVKKTFNPSAKKGEINPMVESLVKSVLVNKAVLKKNKKALKDWQNDYYYELFPEFKKLVTRHNEIYSLKVNDLIMNINLKKQELKSLVEEIKKLKDEKALLEK